MRRPAELLRAADARLGRRSVVALAVVALLLLGAGLVARDLVTVRDGLVQARDGSAGVLAAVDQGRLGAVASRLRTIDGDVQRAASATEGLGWRIAAALPGLDRRLDAAAEVTRTAASASRLAVGLVGAIEGLEGPDGTYALRSGPGAIDLHRLTDMADDVAGLEPAPLRRHLERLRGSEDVGALGPFDLDRTRDRVLDLGTRLAGVTDTARTLAAVLPSFLGAEEPKEYFLAMQNPAELRGTGGLIGFFATLRIEDGRLTLSQPERYEVFDAGEDIPAATGDGPDLPEGFHERYWNTQATTFLANVNLDPDLPTVATAILHLYEQQRGRRLDGVIAMDPIGLAYAHGAIGPVQIPAGIPTAGLPNPLPSRRLAPTLMVDAYDAFGGPNEARKDYLEAVAEATFRDLVGGGWRPLAMVRALATAAQGGHVQLHSTDPETLAAFEQVGLAGRLQATEGVDLLAVTANNSAGNKSDAHVAHRLSGTVRLEHADDGEWRREVELKMQVVNPLTPTGHDVYIVGSSEPGQGFVTPFTGPRGLNRTWFTVWAPATARDIRLARPGQGPGYEPYTVDLHGLTSFDQILETPAESTRAILASYAGPAPVRQDRPDRATYRLRLHRQAKAIPDRVALAIEAPAGWEVVSATAGPTAQLRLFGPDGALGPPVTAEVLSRPGAPGATVRVSGDLVNPVTVDVTLHRRE